jgi:hypothetical protein
VAQRFLAVRSPRELALRGTAISGCALFPLTLFLIRAVLSAQKSLDSGTKNLLASLCLSSRKAQSKNEEKLHDRPECSTR